MAQQNDRKRNVAVVGATGAVGEVVLRLLAERRFPVGELRALASGRSAGTKVRFAGREVEVQEARPEAFEGVDFAFFAATGSLSKELAPEVARRGGVAIDKSSTWRMAAFVCPLTMRGPRVRSPYFAVSLTNWCIFASPPSYSRSTISLSSCRHSK